MVGVENEPGRPVAELVSPIIWRLGALVAAMAAIGIVGVVFSMRSVDDLTQRIEPASRAHEVVQRDLSDLETSTMSWARTGDEQWRDRFAGEDTVLSDDLARLRAAVASTPDLQVAVEDEISAAVAWLDGYARPRVDAPGGPDTYDDVRFALGQDLLGRLRTTRLGSDRALAAVKADSRAAAELRFRLTVVAALAVLLLSWWVIARARRRMLDQLSAPVLALERVVQRMLSNDVGVRAASHRGPKEVRAIARALNDFADAQSRARAVEGRIRDELHVLDTAKDEFVSNVSHELRTPLTTISGYLEMVADEFDGQLEPRHDRMLEATRRNVSRLRMLIDDLLALSRAETRWHEHEPSDVIAMLMEAVTDVRMTAARRGISVEIVAPDEGLSVVGDRTMLYRAFLNVLTNAVKFSHDGGEIEVRGHDRARPGRDLGARPRDRHPEGRARPPRHPLLPRLERDDQRDRRHRAGPAHRADDHRQARGRRRHRVGRGRGYDGLRAATTARRWGRAGAHGSRPLPVRRRTRCRPGARRGTWRGRRRRSRRSS